MDGTGIEVSIGGRHQDDPLVLGWQGTLELWAGRKLREAMLQADATLESASQAMGLEPDQAQRLLDGDRGARPLPGMGPGHQGAIEHACRLLDGDMVDFREQLLLGAVRRAMVLRPPPEGNDDSLAVHHAMAIEPIFDRLRPELEERCRQADSWERPCDLLTELRKPVRRCEARCWLEHHSRLGRAVADQLPDGTLLAISRLPGDGLARVTSGMRKAWRPGRAPARLRETAARLLQKEREPGQEAPSPPVVIGEPLLDDMIATVCDKNTQAERDGVPWRMGIFHASVPSPPWLHPPGKTTAPISTKTDDGRPACSSRPCDRGLSCQALGRCPSAAFTLVPHGHARWLDWTRWSDDKLRALLPGPAWDTLWARPPPCRPGTGPGRSRRWSRWPHPPGAT